jgi:hypothetical protein
LVKATYSVADSRGRKIKIKKSKSPIQILIKRYLIFQILAMRLYLPAFSIADNQRKVATIARDGRTTRTPLQVHYTWRETLGSTLSTIDTGSRSGLSSRTNHRTPAAMPAQIWPTVTTTAASQRTMTASISAIPNFGNLKIRLTRCLQGFLSVSPCRRFVALAGAHAGSGFASREAA